MSETLCLSPICKLPTDRVDRATEIGRKELGCTLPEAIELTDEDLKDISANAKAVANGLRSDCLGCG